MSLPKTVTKGYLLKEFDTFVFDADGVLWTGDIPIPGAAQWINTLLDDPAKNVFITTNNSTKTLEQYMQKVSKMGFERLGRDNLISPAIVLASYFRQNAVKFHDKPVYLIGTENLKHTLENDGGVRCFGVGNDYTEDYTDGDFIDEVDLTAQPTAVVVSFDSRFSYAKLMKAANFLANPDVEFLVCNEDSTFPGPVKGMILPETGPWSAAIQNVTGRKPTAVFGKPHKQMANFLWLRANNLHPDRTVMFGDRLDTDMMFGKSNGFTTVWMQTGVNTLSDIQATTDELKIPDFTCSFADFINQ